MSLRGASHSDLGTDRELSAQPVSSAAARPKAARRVQCEADLSSWPLRCGCSDGKMAGPEETEGNGSFQNRTRSIETEA